MGDGGRGADEWMVDGRGDGRCGAVPGVRGKERDHMPDVSGLEVRAGPRDERGVHGVQRVGEVEEAGGDRAERREDGAVAVGEDWADAERAVRGVQGDGEEVHSGTDVLRHVPWGGPDRVPEVQGRAVRKRRHRKTAAGSGITPEGVDLVLRTSVANIIRRAKAGKVLTAREEELLRRYSGGGKEEVEAEERQYVTPAAFERYLEQIGIRISHKNLYRSYLSPGARYAGAIPRSGDRKRIHRERAAEIIRIVQSRETPNAMNALAMRTEAEARLAAAKAERAEIILAELRGQKIDIGIVRRVWTRAIETFRAELKGLAMALADELQGKPATEAKAVLDGRFHDAMRHLAVELK